MHKYRILVDPISGLNPRRLRWKDEPKKSQVKGVEKQVSGMCNQLVIAMSQIFRPNRLNTTTTVSASFLSFVSSPSMLNHKEQIIASIEYI